MKGKPWTQEQVQVLQELLKQGASLDVVAAKLGKPVEAVRMKIRRLGLEVVDPKGYRTTTSLELPKELPSVEEALKILAAALKGATQPGLDKVEVQRLQVVATLAKTYKDLLADYINYREIERQMIELRAKYEWLVRKKA